MTGHSRKAGSKQACWQAGQRSAHRVFDLALKHCPNCGGGLKSIATILETLVLEKILKPLGLRARAPPRAAARR